MNARVPFEAIQDGQAPALSDYKLTDNLTATRGRIFLTGTQALVRLVLMQRELDRAASLNTAGFVSGYRGSPLGMVDQQLWKAKKLLASHDVRFLPAINEELGGTAVLGTQRVESDPERTVEGVFAMWYGKGPGVDRAGDALKHGNAYGSSPHGGVLVVAGDDHGCVSSSMPHQSDQALIGLAHAGRESVEHRGHARVRPLRLGAVALFGCVGRLQGDFGDGRIGFDRRSRRDPDRRGQRRRISSRPRAACTTAGPTCRASRSKRVSPRSSTPCAISRARTASTNGSRRVAHANVGIVTCGKAHLDLMETLRRLDLTVDDLDAAGRAHLQGRPVVSAGNDALDTFVEGLSEVLVIEEKGPVIEQQIKDHLYNRTQGARPDRGRQERAGRRDAAVGARRIASVAHAAGVRRLARAPQAGAGPSRESGRSRRAANPLERRRCVKRTPYFCSGCPHNTSTKVPEGSIAQAGIGCHFMASWMERDTTGLIQMGGEGVDWASHSMFTKTPPRLPESRRRHLLPLGHSRDSPGGRGEGQHHLQDPL